MKRYWVLLLLLFLFSPSADATGKVRAIVGFEENSSQLTDEGRAELAAFAALGDGVVVEKIDIIALCSSGEKTYHTLKLSRERSYEVYRHLTALIPDEGDYELRYFDPLSPEIAGVDRSDCVIITAYFLNEKAPNLVNPARELFPEEFTSREIPKSLTQTSAHRSPSAQATKKSNQTSSKFTIENIYFEGNSALYTSQSEPTLEEVLSYLLENPSKKVHLIGHVNGKMGRRYLKQAARSNPERKQYKNAVHLSLARAESIREYLVNNGVDPNRVTCEGRGGKDRVYKKPMTERQHRANRRIEIVLSE
jgi:outer membrane protein OmpA-like peptidoglycan-associated protein